MIIEKADATATAISRSVTGPKSIATVLVPLALILFMAAVNGQPTPSPTPLPPPPLPPPNRALLSPRTLYTSKSQVGLTGVGVWLLSVVLDPVLIKSGGSRSREEILMCFPEVKSWGNEQAKVIVSRAIFQDPRSVKSRIGEVILALAPKGVTAAGFSTGSTEMLVGGLVTETLLPPLIQSLKKRAPQPYGSQGSVFQDRDWLPDLVNRTGSWYLISDQIHGARPYRVDLDTCREW